MLIMSLVLFIPMQRAMIYLQTRFAKMFWRSQDYFKREHESGNWVVDHVYLVQNRGIYFFFLPIIRLCHAVISSFFFKLKLELRKCPSHSFLGMQTHFCKVVTHQVKLSSQSNLLRNIWYTHGEHRKSRGDVLKAQEDSVHELQ